MMTMTIVMTKKFIYEWRELLTDILLVVPKKIKNNPDSTIGVLSCATRVRAVILKDCALCYSAIGCNGGSFSGV